MNQTPSTQGPLGFADLMRPGERIAALIYLPVHIVVLPLLLPYLSYAIPGLSTVDLNLIYYSIGFVCCLLLFWRFLHASFNAAWERPGSLLLGVFGGYAMELALSMLLSSLFIIFGLQSVTSPNNEAITAMAPEGLNKLTAMTVFMAPIVEEILFRGLAFGALRSRNRATAWIVSVLLFSFYHVWQYAVIDPLYLLTAVLYIPASIALNWSYERSGSIWAPIFYHMLTNAVGISAL